MLAANVLDKGFSTLWSGAPVIPPMFKSIWISLILIFCLPGSAIGQDLAPSQELIQYVRDAKKAGLKDTEIELNAIKTGWSAVAVKEAMSSARTAANAGAAPAATGPKEKAGPKEKQPAAAQGPEATERTAARTVPAPVTPPVEPPVAAAAARPPADPAAAPPATPPAATPAETAGGGTPTKPVQRNVPDEYRIGEGDVIQVNVWGERDASVGAIVVRPDGMITMPLIKDIRIAGLTPAEAEKVISEPLSKIIKAADVTVIVNQINSKKVFLVGGGVKKEGPLSYTYRMTVMQALSEAGGLTDYAKRKKIYVLRTENGRQFKLHFDYDAVLNGERMELNIPLMPGDTVVVPNH
jgi:polysaccharide export outer membrane protein